MQVYSVADLNFNFKNNCSERQTDRAATIKNMLAVLRIRIRWIRKILASWIRIRKNMRIYGSGSKWQNINQKLQQQKITIKPKSELLTKERL